MLTTQLILWLAGFLLVAGSLAIYFRLAKRWQVVATATEDRHLHSGQVISGAGLAFLWPSFLLLAAFVPFYFDSSLPNVLWQSAAIGLFLLVATGFVDDRHHLPAHWRLVVQLVSVGLLLIVAVPGLQNAGYGPLWWLLIFIGMLWWLNLFNFMDGADGMAAWHAMLALSFYAAVYHFEGQPDLAFVAIFVALSVAVFLLWNFPRARLFMGDAGSLGLAWLIAALAVFGLLTGTVSPGFVFVLHSPFILDATLTLLSRWQRGQSLTQAHREHLYQQLIANGLNHPRVSLAYALVTLISGGVAWFVSQLVPPMQWLLALSWTGLLIAAWFFLKRPTKS